jgi:hypothetical protein
MFRRRPADRPGPRSHGDDMCDPGRRRAQTENRGDPVRTVPTPPHLFKAGEIQRSADKFDGRLGWIALARWRAIGQPGFFDDRAGLVDLCGGLQRGGEIGPAVERVGTLADLGEATDDAESLLGGEPGDGLAQITLMPRATRPKG